MTRFCVFQRILKIFQNSKNQIFQIYCKSTFWSIAIITRIILAHKIEFLVFFGHPKHSKESNTISELGVARQNWCILSKNDKQQKFSFFSEVYDGGIFQTLEPKMEPPQLPIPRGPASKFEKSMFFEPASLNIIQNFIFKLQIEQDNSRANGSFFYLQQFRDLRK